MKGKSLGCAIAALIGIVLVAVIIWGVSVRNQMVSLDESTKAQWGNVQNSYQRRGDLIPNLVATVKGYADHELNTLVQTIEARAKATQMTINPDQLTEENIQRFQQSQGELSQALGRLMVVREQYPNLKADQHFTQLMDELAGTENRISTERNKFNRLAQEYNVYIRKFPASLIAGFSGFVPKGYFQADADKQAAPTVKF